MKNKLYFVIFTIFLLISLILSWSFMTNELAEALKHQPKVVITNPNAYYKNTSFRYVKESKDFIPYSVGDLRDIFYSILNNGYKSFTFYCPTEYTNCIYDVNELSSNTEILTNINNFVSPFNNFSNIRVIYDETGEVTVEVTKLYSNTEITAINNKIDSLITELITNEMNDEEKILTIHNYIINNTKYDVDRIDGTETYKSTTAYGPLFEGYAVCGGYADVMALFLNKFNIPNFRVASSTHVWNAVYLNDSWLHLDLTWDDPINDDKTDSLIHKFYLITTSTLEEYDISDHEYDKTIYRELGNL